MSRREDVKSVLNGKTPEYVPWFGDLDYWLTYLKKEGLIPKEYQEIPSETGRLFSGGLTDAGLQKLHQDLGVGFYLQAVFPFETIYHNTKVETKQIGPDSVTSFETPYGVLTERWRFVDSTYSAAPVERLVKTAGDLKALRYLYENIEYRPDYAFLEERAKLVGENGIVLAYTPKTPMMELIALKSGVENVIMELLGEEPEEFEEVLELMREKHTEATEIAIHSPAEYIFVPDNLSSEIAGGAIYDQYIQEVHEDWTERIRKAGKKSMVHLDGTLNPLLHKLSYAGFDVIEAVTPGPVGDIALKDLRSHVKEETIIWGGLPSGFFSPSYPEEAFERWLIELLDVIKKDGRFVMGVADQIVPGTSFERIKKVSEYVERYGKCR